MIKPVLPDCPVRETYQDFLDGRDVFKDTALRLIEKEKTLP